jgi:hypothetical protein
MRIRLIITLIVLLSSYLCLYPLSELSHLGSQIRMFYEYFSPTGVKDELLLSKPLRNDTKDSVRKLLFLEILL